MSVSLGALLIVGLFLIFPLTVSAVAQLTAPPLPEYITYVLQNNKESCEEMPSVLRGEENDIVLSFKMEWNLSDNSCILNGQLASPRLAFFTFVIDNDAILAIEGSNRR